MPVTSDRVYDNEFAGREQKKMLHDQPLAKRIGLSSPSWLAARPIDRMGLLTLITSIYFFQVWGIRGGWPSSDLMTLALVVMSAIGILLPRFFVITVLNSAFFTLHYLKSSPIGSNNEATAFFVSIVILAGTFAACLRTLRGGSTTFREYVFETIAGPGRYILAIMYFYGIYHKINAGFLDPDVSCAVVLYRPLAHDLGLEDWALGHYAAIYGTFVVEAVAMILLFSPRYKKIGILFGIPFHIAIGWTGYAYYKDFSTIVLSLYAMFLARETFDAGTAAAGRWFGSVNRAATFGRIVLFSVFGAYLVSIGALVDPAWLNPTHEGFTWFFTIYSLAFYIFAIAFVPLKRDAPLFDLSFKPAWLAIVPIAFFLNGASPYLGLKTDSAIAMYSNLYTEGNETNHLIHGQLPFAFDYQNDIIVPLSSSSESFDASAGVGTGRGMVRYEFDKILSHYPSVDVDFLQNGEQRSLGSDWVNTYEATPALLRRYFIFRPIEFDRPHICTH